MFINMCSISNDNVHTSVMCFTHIFQILKKYYILFDNIYIILSCKSSYYFYIINLKFITKLKTYIINLKFIIKLKYDSHN